MALTHNADEQWTNNVGWDMFTLEQILGLVGTLDDSPGDDTARERFRFYLRNSLGSIGDVRDFVEACLRNKGSQYDRALQDLVNHSASLLGFSVEYGRYRGVTNDIGHDGLWVWNDFTFVVEVKTTDVYSIQTATLIGYVDRLISAGRIPDWSHALGLYVFGRTDSDLKQLANTIYAENRTRQLRIATIDSILSLAELVQEGQISTAEVATILRPGGVFVSDTVSLLARIASRSMAEPQAIAPPRTAVPIPPSRPNQEPTILLKKAPRTENKGPNHRQEPMYLLTPVSDDGQATAQETIKGLLAAGWYVFGARTPGRRELKPGDHICFYQSGVGVVAAATVESAPEQKAPPLNTTSFVKNLDKFPWSFQVVNPRFFFDTPVVLDQGLRSLFDAFSQRDPQRAWAWFVQGTRKISGHDFCLLTQTAEGGADAAKANE